MHYKDGTPVALGDHVRKADGSDPKIGQVIGGTPGSTCCNLMVAYSRVMTPEEATTDPYSQIGSQVRSSQLSEGKPVVVVSSWGWYNANEFLRVVSAAGAGSPSTAPAAG